MGLQLGLRPAPEWRSQLGLSGSDEDDGTGGGVDVTDGVDAEGQPSPRGEADAHERARASLDELGHTLQQPRAAEEADAAAAAAGSGGAVGGHGGGVGAATS